MNDAKPGFAVLAFFENRTAAEIACALLADASIRSDEPEAAGDGGWCVGLRGAGPEVSERAEVILRRAGARSTCVAIRERQQAA
jgi:hypothetical protein